MAKISKDQLDALIEILQGEGLSQFDAANRANEIVIEAQKNSSEPLLQIDTILWRDYGEGVAKRWSTNYDAAEVAAAADAEVSDGVNDAAPGAGLTPERRAEIDQMMLAGADPNAFIGEDREYAASVVDPNGVAANLDIIEARQKIEADVTDQMERDLFNQVFSPDLRQKAVDDYNASNIGQDVSSYNELLERYANQDPQAALVIEDSVMGQADDYVRVATGIGPNGVTYEFVDSTTNQSFQERGLSTGQIAAVVKAQKFMGIDVDSAVAITNYSSTAGPNPARLLELQQELKKAEIEAATASRFASADPERTRFLQQRVRSLEESIRQEEEKSRGRSSQALAGQNMARFESARKLLGGHADLALIALEDPALAQRIYEQGNTVGLTGDDFATIQRAFVQAGVTNAETGKNLIGDSGKANAWLPGMTDEQFNMLMGGAAGGGGGTTTVKYTLPDPEAVKEGLRAVYQSWYMTAPTDAELDAFTNVINTKTKQEAMKLVPAAATAANTYRAWGDTSGNAPQGNNLEVLANTDVDRNAQALKAAREDSQYEELFGKKDASISEAQYASQFASQAQSMLGAEGASAVGAIQQGMRGNEMNATSRMIMYDKKYRDSSTLMGRMATSAQSIARYI